MPDEPCAREPAEWMVFPGIPSKRAGPCVRPKDHSPDYCLDGCGNGWAWVHSVMKMPPPYPVLTMPKLDASLSFDVTEVVCALRDLLYTAEEQARARTSPRDPEVFGVAGTTHVALNEEAARRLLALLRNVDLIE